MNARDIIKLAAQLYVYDALKKKITILTNIQKGKDINVDIFLPKVTDVTVSDFAKHLQKAIESQPEEERAKHRKFFGEPISFCRCVARGNLITAMAAILKPSEMSDTDFVLKINEKMNELWSEEALIRQGAKIKQELLEIQKTLDELEKQGEM